MFNIVLINNMNRYCILNHFRVNINILYYYYCNYNIKYKYLLHTNYFQL